MTTLTAPPTQATPAPAAPAPTAPALKLPHGITHGPSVEGVTQYQLANGLKVLLFPDATKPATTVNVTYLVGSRFEGYGETGMAHLLEHMLFKGTPSEKNVFVALGKRGMDFNGSTWFDRTNYHETFAASDANLEWALKMEAERMTRSTFSKQELDTEMTVVRNEFEMGENNPSNVLTQKMQSVAFDWHNYAHDTIGARSDIENVPFASLRAFYAKYYQPDNAVLVVAGKFDPQHTLDLVAKYFGPLPRPTRVLPKLYTVEPVQDGERAVTLRRVGSQKIVSTLFHTPPGPHPDAVAMEALGEIMTLAPSGRLYKALVETKKAARVETQYIAMHDPGMILFEAQLAVTDDVKPARDAMLATFADVAQNPITDEEVNRVRTRWLKDFDEVINDPQEFGIEISEIIAQGDWRLMYLDRDRWRALKAADVQRVALEYLKPSNMTVGEFVPDAKPDRAPLIASVDVAKMVDGYKGDPPVAPGEAFDTSLANLERRTERYTLPNGLEVALLPRKTRGATVDFELTMNYGDAETLKGQATAAQAVAALLAAGTETKSRQQYADALDALHAQLHFGARKQTLRVSGSTVRDHLDGTLKLTAEALRKPAFAPDEFARLQRAWLASLEQGSTEPEAIVRRAAARMNNPYPSDDIRYASTLDEDVARVKALDPVALRSFHDRFYGANHAQLAIVGDFDPVAVRAEIAALFGDWNAQAAFTRAPEPFVATHAAAEVFMTPDKANASLQGVLAVPLNDRSPDFAALLVADRVMGGGVESRIPQRVREHDGLAYGVGTGVRPATIDENSTILFYSIFAPQNLDRVKAGFSEELARAGKDGFTAAEVNEAKQALLEERMQARADDPTLAASLAAQSWLGRTWQQSAELDAAIAAVTPAQAYAAYRKYYNAGAIAYAYAGDFAKKP
ncbi:MAG: insulinase family protein [Proteobacteria bacterium]|nr:insulinase family protein [Pseudomonadota bacterium]